MTTMKKFIQAVTAGVIAFAASAVLAAPYTNFVVFGDSLSDPGNDFAITTKNGTDFSTPFPPPPYFQGHFSNGLTAAEYVAQRSGLPTQNYAQGGATTGTFNIDDGRCIPDRTNCTNALYQLAPNQLSGIQTQVQTYLSGPKTNIASTLFFLQGGGNDFFAQSIDWPDNHPANGVDFVSSIVTNLFQEVQLLVNQGARHIALSNLPNIARTPYGADLPPLNQAILAGGLNQVNGGIAQIWAAFQGIVIPIDLFDVVNDVVDNPAAFGFSNATDPCIGSASCAGYAFFDDVHPTTAFHAVAAERILVATGLPEPGTLLLVAFGLIGCTVRRFAR